MSQRVGLFGMQIDNMRMDEATQRLLGWVSRGLRDCRYVVTPNVDHTVVIQTHPRLQQSYADASLVLADGKPVVLASRLLRRPLPECVTGADLVPSMFEAVSGANRTLKVYLLGAGPGVAERAAGNIHARWKNVEVVGTYSPEPGFEDDPVENDAILSSIEAAQPDVLIIGLGAPKQELWVHQHRTRIRVHVALCVGATIDYLAGEKSRAPLWIRQRGFEWLYRIGCEPRRLSGRYMRDAWVFPRLVWQQWRSQSSSPEWVEIRYRRTL